MTARRHCTVALVTSALTLAVVSSCTSSPSRPHGASSASPARLSASPTPTRSAPTAAARRLLGACRPSLLRVVYRGTGFGTGNVFGAFVMHYRGARPCAIRVPIVLTALDASGQRVAGTRRLALRPDPTHVVPIVRGRPRRHPADELHAASVWVHGSTGAALAGGCPRRFILTPAAWRVTVGASHLVVANAAAAQPMFTCTRDHIRFGVSAV